MSNVRLLPTPPQPLEEPDWTGMLPDQGRGRSGNNQPLRDAASRYWHTLTVSLAPYGTIARENEHALMRLVLAYTQYDRATAELFKGEMITAAPKTGTAKASIWRTAQRQAADAALSLEGELGISPRRRGSAKKASKPARAGSTADSYLPKPRR